MPKIKPISEKYQNSLNGIKFIDLFCGIGGFRLALESFGADCVFSSEINEKVQDVYEKNYGEKPAGDITKIDAKDIPDHDIICAGFPCQAFSISGNQKGFNDDRGNLFLEIVRIATHHKPKIMILENVPNLLRHDKGRTITVILDHLKSAGYKIFFEVLNASYFGIPQARKRVYFVCVRDGLDIDNFKFITNIKKPTRIIDFCLDDSEVEPLKTRSILTKLHNVKRLQADFEGNFPQKAIAIGCFGNGGQHEIIHSSYGHSPTASSSLSEFFLINNKIRRLEVIESLRISGFPDDFQLSEFKGHSYMMCSNTVIPQVIQYIIKQIVDDKILS